MTGAQLRAIIDRLSTTDVTVARKAGYSRQYLSRLARSGDNLLPADSSRVILSALLTISRDAAAVYLELTGQPIEVAS